MATEPKVERNLDPKSVASVEKMRSSGQSVHHKALQERGNLDKAPEGRSEAGHGQSEHHTKMQRDGNMDGSRKEYDEKQR